MGRKSMLVLILAFAASANANQGVDGVVPAAEAGTKMVKEQGRHNKGKFTGDGNGGKWGKYGWNNVPTHAQRLGFKTQGAYTNQISNRRHFEAPTDAYTEKEG